MIMLMYPTRSPGSRVSELLLSISLVLYTCLLPFQESFPGRRTLHSSPQCLFTLDPNRKSICCFIFTSLPLVTYYNFILALLQSVLDEDATDSVPM
ncbi:hypothetical protein BT96DRAFT_582806 [Gymnopus androsaceus JB14]|uniref:Uncharacterized protein n=1 Tax=Gymnopus androsaceus JB14 TaxID=1447944 RepID=A0A6A4IL14_9AGAR|nr:hypothetical protein BT96DRAFT_582806 [Gymnopus androsaceus JB14]